MSPQPAPVLELAVFTVRTPKTFSTIHQQTHDALATLAGYRTSVKLRGLSDGVFADLVVWDSLEAAQQASHAVREDPRFSSLMSSIAALKLYAHYRLATDTTALLAQLRLAPVVEVAAYTVRDVAVQLAVHGQVHHALRSLEGHRSGAPAHQIEDPTHFADVIGWENPEAHKRASEAILQRADLAAFFSGIQEMKVFELFFGVA
jgi:heme-degrading monooxygenase HmoA